LRRRGIGSLCHQPDRPVPDFIPVLGQHDDVGMIVVGIGSAILAYMMRRERARLESGE
jgi:uncharacterized membrane protein YkvA (DUF1232 family)